MDAVLQLQELRQLITKDLEEGRVPFWVEFFELSSHEYKTRVDQHLHNLTLKDDNWYWLMDRAIKDYQTYWSEKDGLECTA